MGKRGGLEFVPKEFRVDPACASLTGQKMQLQSIELHYFALIIGLGIALAWNISIIVICYRLRTFEMELWDLICFIFSRKHKLLNDHILSIASDTMLVLISAFFLLICAWFFF